MSTTLDALSSPALAEQSVQVPENVYFEPRNQQSVVTTNYDAVSEGLTSGPNYAKLNIIIRSTLSELANPILDESVSERRQVSIAGPPAKRYSFPDEWRPALQKPRGQVLRSFTGRVETIQGLFARVTLRENGEGETLLGDCHASTLKAAQIEEGDLFRMDIKRIAGNVTVLFTKIDPPDRSAEEVASIRARFADLD